jgi:phosphonate transport system ATP-binding protein
MSADALFHLEQVTLQFGTFMALRDLNLTIYPGDRIALIGSSGAGKSTLIRLLNGTLLPSTGKVWAFGRDFAQLKLRQRRQVQQQIGTIHQQLHLVDNLRVIHNVNAGHLGRWSFWKALTSLVIPRETEVARAALTQVGIPEKLYDRTDRLSGGQQQRVAIARVLVQNPSVILADEPIASLDPILSREIMDLLCNLYPQSTLIVSLHDVETALNYCDRILALRHGQLLFDVPTAQLSAAMIADLYRLQA